MGWLGKMVGGTIGFALGGPIGAVAGAAFGHTFDKKEAAYLADPDVKMHQRLSQQKLSNDEETQLTFFVAAFSMLAKIAKADGRVSQEEIASIENFMENDLHLDPESRNTAINIFRQAINSPESFEAFAMQFYRVFNTQPRVIELMMDVLLRVSASDGHISSEEETMLKTAATIFNFSDEAFSRLKSKYIRAVNRYYAILKCDENCSDEEIRKQYRKLVSEYHPDKIASKGLPEEFIKFANDKTVETQEAYDNIRKERRF